MTYDTDPAPTTTRPPAVAVVAERLRRHMDTAVLSFPLTPFDDDGQVDIPAFRDHLRHQLSFGPGALFPCCGTGEFFSLSEPEYAELVRAAVEVVDGQVPVVAGVGYGWAQAVRFAEAAQVAGVDALLVMPHYLVSAPQQGLVAQVQEIAARTPLPLVVYQRGAVKFTVDSVRALAAIPTVIGIKDGHSDLDQLQRLKLAAPPDFLFFNGALTAEMQARPYASIGIGAYSSAVHSFAPEIATAFFTALQRGDSPVVEDLLRNFYWPLVALRDRESGYAVSLVKAAAGLRGQRVGPVRAPLTDPTPPDLEDLRELLERGLRLVGAEPVDAVAAS